MAVDKKFEQFEKKKRTLKNKNPCFGFFEARQSLEHLKPSLVMKEAHMILEQNLAISAKVRSRFTTSDRLWLVVDCHHIAH